MKKMLLLTLGLLAFGVTVASAQGTISLAYGVCRIATTTANDFVWPNSNPDCTDPANTGSAATMVSAFKNSATIANFSLATTVLDVLVGNGVGLSDFWIWDAGACHDGGLSGAALIGPTGGITLPTNCGNPYGAAAGQNNSFGQQTFVGTGRVHWENDHGRNSPLSALTAPAAAGGYIGNAVSLGWDDALLDGGTCAGCQDPACFVLNNIKLYNSSGFQAADITAVAPGIQNFVTFYGGTAACPGAVPTKNATWGQVKALYR